jgi:predicted PurR-regulated permease PerM
MVQGIPKGEKPAGETRVAGQARSRRYGAMIEKANSERGTRYLIGAAALVVIIWWIYQAKSFVVWLLVSVFLAVLGAPPLLWLERKRVPSFVAILLVVAGVIGILLCLGAFVGASINSFSNALPLYQDRLQGQFSAFKEALSTQGIEIPDKFLLKYVNPGAVMSLTAGLLSGLSSMLSNIVLILLTVTFILFEASSFHIKLRAALGPAHKGFPPFARFFDDVARYMEVQTALSLATGVIIGIWLFILGVDFPVLWGLLAFLFNYVPYLGAIIAAIPAVFLALIQLGIGPAGYVAAGYVVVYFIIGNVVQPWLMGRRLGLSTLVVFVSLVFWGSLLGLVGMVLAIPITMALKLAFESNEGTRWIAVLLGPELSPADRPLIKQKGTGAGSK